MPFTLNEPIFKIKIKNFEVRASIYGRTIYRYIMIRLSLIHFSPHNNVMHQYDYIT